MKTIEEVILWSFIYHTDNQQSDKPSEQGSHIDYNYTVSTTNRYIADMAMLEGGYELALSQQNRELFYRKTLCYVPSWKMYW